MPLYSVNGEATAEVLFPVLHPTPGQQWCGEGLLFHHYSSWTLPVHTSKGELKKYTYAKAGQMLMGNRWLLKQWLFFV